jgi:hypothetical protein
MVPVWPRFVLFEDEGLMGNFDWSQDQLERDWSESFALIDRMERNGVLPSGESSALAGGVMRCMNGALLKVGEVLEAHAALRKDLALLTEAHRQDVLARQQEEARKDARIKALEREIQELRAEYGQVGAAASARLNLSPPEVFLRQPMVILAQDDYLGVCDTLGQALRMGDFLNMVERGEPGRLVCTSWERVGFKWILSIALTPQGAPAQSYTLEASSVRTPNGNVVTLLRRMSVAGEIVPHAYLLQMFRQLRDGLQKE